MSGAGRQAAPAGPSPRAPRTSRTTPGERGERIAGRRATAQRRIEPGRGLVGDEPRHPQTARRGLLGRGEHPGHLLRPACLQHAGRPHQAERRLGARQVVEAGLDHARHDTWRLGLGARGSLVGMPSVLVAMSGGVDSSVAACLLAEQGYEVVGSHMSLVHLDGVEHGCCGPAARADAAAVAAIGGFPFEICDLTAGLRRGGDRRLRGRARGGPDAEPVRALQRRDQVRRVPAPRRRARHRPGRHRALRAHAPRRRRSWHLLRGADAAKDQSYMLHMLGQEQLARSLFPVGGLPKAETRALAERFGLPVASKPDSQELCFAPSGDAGGFVRAQAPALVHAGGEVVDPDGAVLGRARRHVRLHGRAATRARRGHRIAGLRAGGRRADEPRGRRARRAVGQARPGRRSGLVGRRASRRSVRSRPRFGSATAATRRDAVITPDRPTGSRSPSDSRSARSRPGQSVVVYRGDEVLGGGRIVHARSASLRRGVGARTRLLG